MSKNYPTREMMNAYYEAEEKEKKEKEFKKKRVLNPKDYLNNSFDMENGKYSKKVLRFRPIPIDNENPSPFVKIKTHFIRANGKSSYPICLKHTKGIEHLELGNECPFCELQDRFQQEARLANSDEKRKQFYEEANKYRIVEQYIMRGIEKECYVYIPNSKTPEKIDKTGEGVKFWRFTASKKGDGFFDIIRNLDEEANQESVDKGEGEYTIFDLENGRDLKITSSASFTNEGKSTFTVSKNIQITSDKVSLSDDIKQVEEWINDDKHWYDVFTPKEYGVLKVLALGGIPMFDIETKTWTDRKQFDTIKNSGKTPKFDVEKEEWVDEESYNKSYNIISEKEKIEEIEKTYSESTENSDDDLPF